MHHALFLQEILLNIFGHYHPSEPHWTPDRRQSAAVLAALARTCRTFKEPALDVLWSELIDLTPLSRCIPDACYVDSTGRCHSFERPLNEAEWRVLRSYTRRVWHIVGHVNPNGWLDNDSLIMICSSPPFSTSDPLFPNLRSFYWQWLGKMIPPVHVAVPSLTKVCLGIVYCQVSQLQEFLDTISDLCPNFSRFQVAAHPSLNLGDTVCSHVRRLTNPRELYCRGINLDAEMIMHLSGKATFQQLSFSLEQDEPKFTSPPVSLKLVQLTTYAQALEPVTGFLSQIQLPKVDVLEAEIHDGPSKEAFRSYIMTAQGACSSNSVTTFRIQQRRGTHNGIGQFTLDDFRPCMVFTNLRHIDIDMSWPVELSVDDLLTLASAWPQIQTLCINSEWGWRTEGVQLHGLLRLLQTCLSLSKVCIAIDTESCIDSQDEFGTFVPPSRSVVIDLADSLIEADYGVEVSDLVDVFWKLGLHTCALSAWNGEYMDDSPRGGLHKRRWNRVFKRLKQRASKPEGQLGKQGSEAVY